MPWYYNKHRLILQALFQKIFDISGICADYPRF